MATASILTTVSAAPALVQVHGVEMATCDTLTADSQKIPIFVKARPGSTVANSLLSQAVGNLVILTGDLQLDEEGNLPALTLRSLCKGYPEQFLNEVAVTGRLSGQIREAEKSDSTSIAVNRTENGAEKVDWFRVRVFGLNRERLNDAPKGALATASGILEMRTSKDDKPFVEIKTRVLHLHAKPRGHDAAEGKEAAGYASADFDGSDAPAMPADWG